MANILRKLPDFILSITLWDSYGKQLDLWTNNEVEFQNANKLPESYTVSKELESPVHLPPKAYIISINVAKMESILNQPAHFMAISSNQINKLNESPFQLWEESYMQAGYF